MVFIQPGVFHFLSNVNIRAKSHFAIFHVPLFLRNTCCFQFLCTEYGTVWGITQCFSICILFAHSWRSYKTRTILNIPPKSVCVHRLIKLTSYEISFRSQHAEINGNRQLAGISFVISVCSEIWMFHMQRRRSRTIHRFWSSKAII